MSDHGKRLPFSNLLLVSLLVQCHFVFSLESDGEKFYNALKNSSLGRTSDDLLISGFNKLSNNLIIDLDLLTSGLSSRLSSLLNRSNTSSSCEASLRKLVQDGKAKKTWALKGSLSFSKNVLN